MPVEKVVMSLRFYLHTLCKLSLLLIAFCLLLDCSKKESVEQNIIIVKVPPFADTRLSQVENYWRFQRFLFPQQESPNPLPQGLPHDDSILFVSIDVNGNIKLNIEEAGNILNTNSLTARLTYIFSEREQHGVYEPKNQKTVKVVGIRAAPSTKYGDFMKVVEAVKQSDADPIVLLFDDDARPKIVSNKSKPEKTK